jgi:hypothetical protein
MTEKILVKFFEHNNWANGQVIYATEHREQIKSMLSIWE